MSPLRADMSPLRANMSPLRKQGSRVRNVVRGFSLVPPTSSSPPLKACPERSRRIRGVRGVINEQVTDNSPLKVIEFKGVMNERSVTPATAGV